MFIAFDKNENLVLSTKTAPTEGPFSCPTCRVAVILKQGDIKTHHFAHAKGLSPCPRQTGGESIAHATIKMGIYRDALTAGIEAHIEYRLGDRVADLVLHGRSGRRVAVEVQLSPQKASELFSRTTNHTQYGYSTLWVVQLPVGLEEAKLRDQEQHKVRAFQRDIHDYFGEALFQYRGDLVFDVIHLMGYKYQRSKFYKINFKPVTLQKSVDDDSATMRWVTAPSKWWERKTAPEITYDEELNPQPDGWDSRELFDYTID